MSSFINSFQLGLGGKEMFGFGSLSFDSGATYWATGMTDYWNTVMTDLWNTRMDIEA